MTAEPIETSPAVVAPVAPRLALVAGPGGSITDEALEWLGCMPKLTPDPVGLSFQEHQSDTVVLRDGLTYRQDRFMLEACRCYPFTLVLTHNFSDGQAAGLTVLYSHKRSQVFDLTAQMAEGIIERELASRIEAMSNSMLKVMYRWLEYELAIEPKPSLPAEDDLLAAIAGMLHDLDANNVTPSLGTLNRFVWHVPPTRNEAPIWDKLLIGEPPEKDGSDNPVASPDAP